LIDSRARRARTGGAISESVLSHFKRLRRHSRVAEQRTVGRASAEAVVDFTVLALWVSTRRKTKQKRKESFRRSEMKRFVERS
jgi:hypothetical protein